MDYDALSALVFYVFAAMAFICAICVVGSRNPVTSAMCMALSFLATAAILFGMGAQFLGIAQLIVYAGAILVLFLFVVMMLDVKKEEGRLASLPKAMAAVVIASVFAGMVAHVALDLPGATDGACPFKSLFCGDCCQQAEADKADAPAVDSTADRVTAPAPDAAKHDFGGPLPELNPAVAAKELDPETTDKAAEAATSIPDAKLLGMTLYSRYSIAFVLLAFALLGGTVGAIALGRKLRKD